MDQRLLVLALFSWVRIFDMLEAFIPVRILEVRLEFFCTHCHHRMGCVKKTFDGTSLRHSVVG